MKLPVRTLSAAVAGPSTEIVCKDDKTNEEPVEIPAELDDPCQDLPKNRLEKLARISRGPHHPCLSTYPVKTVGKGRNSRNRSFKSTWFEYYKWLEYSVVKDAAYCFACRCFALNDSSATGSIENAFTTTGFSSWHKAHEMFKTHEKSRCHASSMVGWENFNASKPVDVMLDDAKEAELKEKEKRRLENHKYMSRLIDIVRLLAKGGKPLRGHDESEESDEKGLFLEIVSLLQKYDPMFKSYIENAPKNCVYLSNRIQNDILASLSTVILRTISDEIKGQPFAVIADETSDVSHHEQLAVVFRYIPNGDKYPVERLVSLQRLKSTDAGNIFKAINCVLTELGVLWKDVVSVCFDGASAMAGEFTGVQARCKEVNSSIMYVHCYAHCLNLALVSACTSHKENPIIFDFFGIVQIIFSYIEGSPKRHAIYEDIVKETTIKIKTLKSLSDTRWACRSEAVSVIHAHLVDIVKAIEECTESTSDSKLRAKGKGILLQVQSFNFIASLQIMHPILQLVVKVSKALQNPKIDLCQAVEDVESLALALIEMRNNEEEFEEIFTKTEEMCNLLDVQIPTVRKRKVSVVLEDIGSSCSSTAFYAETKKDELKLFTFHPVLDSLVQGINSRFGQETKKVISATGKLMGLNLGPYKCESSDFEVLSKQFRVNATELEAEVKLLKTKRDMDTDFPPKTVPDWIDWLSKFQRSSTYKSFGAVMNTFATMPVTSCTSERTFSKLTIIKSKLRSTMRQERLQNLMIPFVEQKLAACTNTNAIIDEFKNIVPFRRRMAL